MKKNHQETDASIPAVGIRSIDSSMSDLKDDRKFSRHEVATIQDHGIQRQVGLHVLQSDVLVPLDCTQAAKSLTPIVV